jgi:capsular exopolysaccharide synthesis family protein
MQDAEKHSSQHAKNSTAVAELLAEVKTEAEVASGASPVVQPHYRRINTPALQLPILRTQEEEPSTHAAFEAYRSLRTKLTRFQRAHGIRSFVVGSSVSGEGKTISAINTAICLTQLETQKVLLVDADIRTAGLSKRLGAEKEPGLADILAGRLRYCDSVLATDIPRLFLVSAGELFGAAADLFAGSEWPEFVASCNQSFDLIIIDSPPILGLADFDLITAPCDGVLMVVRAGKTKCEILTEARQHLQDKKVLGVILNGYEHQRKHAYGYQHYYYSGSRTRH